MDPIRLYISGQPPRKANSRQIGYRWSTDSQSGLRRKVPFSRKSDSALQWVSDALRQIPGSARLGVGSKDHPLRITFWVRYASRRPDLSIELVLDMLQQAGVISDDRWVYETHAYKEIHQEAGVHVLIEEAECAA